MKHENLRVDDYFTTSDLALTTSISLYFPLEVIDRTQNPYKAHFLFRKDPEGELVKFIECYWRGEVRIEPQAYFNQLKSIKARLYSERSEHGAS